MAGLGTISAKIYKCADYNVAWICALRDTELLAARVLLDEQHTTPAYNSHYDRNTYIYGRYGEHNAVIACLPGGRSGNVNASHLTGPMFQTFPNIKITLLVGIGGGVPLQSLPDPSEDIYLGDVVIGWPGDGGPAVIQYDLGRLKMDEFELRGSVEYDDLFFFANNWHLTQALDVVISNHDLDISQTKFHESLARLQKLPKFANRAPEEDKLFEATYKHEGDYYSKCSSCLPKNLVQRPNRAQVRSDGFFKFHQGTITSGGAVIQDGETRDKLSKRCENARCFEMEAVGVNINSRCLVIRGLADYADSHKNDLWKYVAAGNAAIFAKELLLTMKASGLTELSGISAPRTPISTLPGTLSIDPDFVGRDDIIRQMDEEFLKSQRVVLVGLGGIGKTEIAVQYAHRYRKKNPECHVLWIYGSTPQSFDDAYRRIGKELEIQGCDDPLFDYRERVPQELNRSQTGPWIMIVDNADDYNIYFPPPDGALSESEQRSKYLACCLPYGAESGGRLIITTRYTKVGQALLGDSTPIEVPQLTPVDARLLLRSKVPAEKWEDEAAETLLKELGYVPLAITQAAAFVKRNTMIDMKFYLGKLCQFHLKVTDVLSYELHDPRRQGGTPNAIFLTWRISYQQIKLENPEAADKLSLMAVLDSQAVPRTLLIKGDEMEIAEMDAIQVLLDFSLIKGDQQYQSFSMHPLQQLSTQNWLRLDSSRLEKWQDHSLVLLSARMPEFSFEAIETRKSCAVLLPHATIAVSYESTKLNYRSLLLYKMSIYENSDIGRYQDAYQHALQSYEESLKVHGETSDETFDRKVQLAKAMIGVDKLDEQEKLGKELDREIEIRYPDRNMSEARVAIRSADEFCETGERDAAFRGFERALTLQQASPNPQDVIHCLDRLAYIAEQKGQLEQSESLYRRAMQEATNHFPENHPEIFAAMKKVGRVVQGQGRIAEAGQLFRLMLLGREEVYGMKHPDTMEAIRVLAENLTEEGKLGEAEVLTRRVLEFNLENLGLSHRYTQIAVENLSSILWELKRFKEAIEVDDIIFLTLKDVPTDVLIRRALMLYTEGNLLESEHMYRKALENSQEQLKQDHPDNLDLLKNLAYCLVSQEKCEAAEHMYRKALNKSQEQLGHDHPDNLDLLGYLAHCLASQEKCEAAEHMYRKTLEKSQEQLGHDHPDNLGLMKNLAYCLEKQEKYEAAENMYRKALKKSQKQLGHDHPDSLDSMKDLADCLQKQEKWEAAEVQLRQILELHKKDRGEKDVGTTIHHEILATTLCKQEKYQAALTVIQDILERIRRHHPEEITSIERLEEFCNKMAFRVSRQSDEQDAANERATKRAKKY